MEDAFVVLFVTGVTPGKWTRMWNERMRRRPLDIRAASNDDALSGVLAGSAHMAFLRDVDATDELNVIPLYRETPVVVTSRESLLASLDSITCSDLDGLDEPRQELLDDTHISGTLELLAAGVGYAILPQSVARAHSRKDLVARPIVDAPDTGIGLAWRADISDDRIETFVGIVRGRTVNSSR
ncbi:MAG TPA: LysR family transcriptional regulator substrate-binding protein [Pseudolysinimonas sp.]|nr:LysR family transcriptional regulator substrate-binding protein [Pseudolysinimonas sp.]